MKWFKASLLCLAIVILAAGIAYCEDKSITTIGKANMPKLPEYPVISFHAADERVIMKLMPDGKLWLAPDCTREQVAKRLIEIYEECFFSGRLRDLSVENANLKAKIERLEEGAK